MDLFIMGGRGSTQGAELSDYKEMQCTTSKHLTISTYRRAHRQTDTHTHTDRQTDRQTDTHTHTHTHTHTQKDMDLPASCGLRRDERPRPVSRCGQKNQVPARGDGRTRRQREVMEEPGASEPRSKSRAPLSARPDNQNSPPLRSSQQPKYSSRFPTDSPPLSSALLSFLSLPPVRSGVALSHWLPDSNLAHTPPIG